MLAGMISRPAAISSRIKPTGIFSRSRDKGHLFGDLSLARKVHLGHVGVARPRRFELALYDPLSARLQESRAVPFPLLLIVESPHTVIRRLGAFLIYTVRCQVVALDGSHVLGPPTLR